VKSIPPPSAAKESFERALFSLILPRKINENSARSKYYLAASAAKGGTPAFLHNSMLMPPPKDYFSHIQTKSQRATRLLVCQKL
jgi:hypothetical protein